VVEEVLLESSGKQMLRRVHVVVVAVHVVPVVVDAAHAVEHVGLAVRVGL
jgi:hypothetical protein